MPTLVLRVPPDLQFLLPAARRGPVARVSAGGTDTVGHVVQSIGVPLTEVGALIAGGGRISPTAPVTVGVVALRPVDRPQPTPTSPPRFLLDVHLGSLARRLRLLGLDAAYDTDADDPALVERAALDQRVLLTQDRGLLRRRAVVAGALVRGAGADAQLADVLDRFAPPLAPWTRCTRCSGGLERVPLATVVDRLAPGTRQTYRDFARCPHCGWVYWRGAHGARLERVVASAERAVRTRRTTARLPDACPPNADGRELGSLP